MPTTVEPLRHSEAERVMDLLDRCSNRTTGSFRRPGARRYRERLFRVLDDPSPASWLRAHQVVVSSRMPLTLGRAVSLFTDFDQSSHLVPSRRQLLLALSRATEQHSRLRGW